MPGMVNLINEVLPGLPVHIMTSQVDDSPDYTYFKEYFDNNYTGVETLANPFKQIMGEPRYGDTESAWGRFCDRWGQMKMEAFAKGCLAADTSAEISRDILNRFPQELIEEWKRDNPAAVEAYRNAGFVLYVSGTTFNFGRLQVRDFWTYALHFAMPLIIARHMRIPYGISGQSYDAIDWPVDLAFRPLFKDAEFIFSRDTDSAAYLRQRDLDNAVSGYRPDTTFFFNVRDEAWAERFLQHNGLTDRRFLVLITRHSAPAFDKTTEWDKVGGDPTAGSVTALRQQEQMRKLRAFIEQWTKETGIPILMALETRAAQAPMREWLDRELSREAQESCVWLDEFWTTEQAYSVYRRARIVISMEMHSVIMAIQCHTPTVHIPFREAGRKARMVQDVGLGDWLLDIDEMAETGLLDTCLQIHEKFEESVGRTTEATRMVAGLGKDVIDRVTKSWKPPHTGNRPHDEMV
jgi:polysaccharide pyruvyl transferase WcaK-like protein